MPAAPRHPDEGHRLHALAGLAILDTPPEAAFDDLVLIAATLCAMPMALISLVDDQRQWFKARHGLGIGETPREQAFCAHAILDPGRVLVVEDARCDHRFSDNALVTGAPYLVSYAGVPLRDPHTGQPLGTLCVLDHRPRSLTPAQLAGLAALARQAETLLQLRRRNQLYDRAVAKLQASEANLHATLASSPVGVFITDPHGHCSFVNPAWCRIAGMDFASALGDGWIRAIHPEDRGPVQERWYAATAAHGVFTSKHRFMHSDGQVVWTVVRGAEIRSGEAMIGYIGMVEDVTEEVVTREALERARGAAESAARAKSDFLATMSHEIRTPLNGVIGMTELMLGTRLSTEQRDYVDAARSCGESLLSLINDILDFSKIESGRLELESQPFSPRSLVEDTMAMVAERCQAKRVELYLMSDASVPQRLMGDQARLRQILVNLLGNAVKFTDSGEVRVELSGAPAGDGRFALRVAVRDTGIGIPAEHIGQLFQAFTQADSQTTRRFGGTGLGLAISHRLAGLMGGDITATSVEGQGSTFTLALALPRVAGADQFPEFPVGTCVLLVDDHAGASAATAAMLTSAGIIVERCATTEAAEARLRNLLAPRPAAVVIDGGMPEMADGVFIRRLHGDGSIVLPPLILACEMNRRAGVAEDLYAAVLMRPLRQAALFEAIRACLNRRAGRSRARARTLSSELRCRVLVAEDNPVNQMLAAAMLRKMGCHVDIVADGQLAIEACAGIEYDLVLMDCLMPRIDGFEATRRIRAARKGAASRLPIVALTANALEGDRERCLAAGMDDHLPKPVSMASLEKTLMRWIAGQAAR
jgi:PAS domain S-box-containing protein